MLAKCCVQVEREINCLDELGVCCRDDFDSNLIAFVL